MFASVCATNSYQGVGEVLPLNQALSSNHFVTYWTALYLICTWSQARWPAGLKHITKRRKRN